MPALLTQLRAATAADHAALEAEIDMASVVTDSPRYRLLLEGFLGIYDPLEALIRAQAGRPDAPAVLDLGPRAKTPWLLTDLRALGLDEAARDALPRASATNLPAVDSPGAALGCAYVLEGATLGGRQITGLLAGTAVPLAARTFFAGYGAATGERWREFCGAVEGFAGQDDAAAVRGARGTFAAMREWLSQTLSLAT